MRRRRRTVSVVGIGCAPCASLLSRVLGLVRVLGLLSLLRLVVVSKLSLELVKLLGQL